MKFDAPPSRIAFLKFKQYREIKGQVQQKECTSSRDGKQTERAGKANVPSSVNTRQMMENTNKGEPPIPPIPPIYLSFTRRSLTRLPNGRLVGVYQETKTGFEILFPTSF